MEPLRLQSITRKTDPKCHVEAEGGCHRSPPRASNAYLYKVRHGVLRTRKDWPIPEEMQTSQEKVQRCGNIGIMQSHRDPRGRHTANGDGPTRRHISKYKMEGLG